MSSETSTGYTHNAVAIVLSGGDTSSDQAHDAVNAMVTDCLERMVTSNCPPI